MKNTLIVGGTSGLGLELARKLKLTCDVHITGREMPRRIVGVGVKFHKLYLGLEDEFLFSERSLERRVDEVVSEIGQIGTLIYAAGFYQEGKIDELDDGDILEMTNVGLVAPAMILQKILRECSKLDGFIAITSTSQWTPRLLEPIYTAVKAGLGMLASSVSLDTRIGKVLVAAPAGMNTNFWRGSRRVGKMLNPKWVAERILELYEGDYKYQCARILREPPRVEIVEKR